MVETQSNTDVLSLFVTSFFFALCCYVLYLFKFYVVPIFLISYLLTGYYVSVCCTKGLFSELQGRCTVHFCTQCCCDVSLAILLLLFNIMCFILGNHSYKSHHSLNSGCCGLHSIVRFSILCQYSRFLYEIKYKLIWQVRCSSWVFWV